jgi:hypothetical protein
MKSVIVEGFNVAYLFKMIAAELLFEVTIMVHE